MNEYNISIKLTTNNISWEKARKIRDKVEKFAKQIEHIKNVNTSSINESFGGFQPFIE